MQLFCVMVGVESTTTFQYRSPEFAVVINGVTGGDPRSLAAKQQVDEALKKLTDPCPFRTGEAVEIRRDMVWWYRR
jgi:hypothetical protein